MQPIFSISAHDIDAGGLARSMELPLPWLERALDETDITASAPGHADVRLSRSGGDVVVRGKVKATLELPCARCLRSTTHDLEGELSLVLRPAKPDHGAGKSSAAKEGAKHAGKKEAPRGNGTARRPREDEEYEFTSEEADQDVYDGEVVVLDPFLREALLLEVPSFPLCSEDCPGIRPAQRAASQREEPIDPRLSPLRALKTKLRLAPGPEPAEASPGSPGEEQTDAPRPADRAIERPVRAGQPPRPRLQAHRTRGSLGAKSAKKARARATDLSRKKAK